MWSTLRVRVMVVLGMSVVFGWMVAAAPFTANPAALAPREEAADSELRRFAHAQRTER